MKTSAFRSLHSRTPALRSLLQAVLLASVLGGLAFASPGSIMAAGLRQSTSTQAYCTNAAAFVADVTVPDNTSMAPGTSFVKTWRLRNSGTCTWGRNYAVTFSSGARMSAPSPVLLPAVVYPGYTIDVSVPMVAPTAPGSYRGNWLMLSDTGVAFGLGTSGVVPFYVQITVRGSSPTPTPSSAQRITFQPGAISASVSMQLTAGVAKVFILRANAGQFMTISVANPVASLSVQAPTGVVLRPYSQGSTTMGPWTYQLPATGDYRIAVTGSGMNTMVVTIPPGGVTPTPTVAAPQRITFAPGATSATVSMQLVSGQPKVFVVRASAGQMMTISFDAAVNYVDVRSAQGLVLRPAYTDGSTFWQFYLPYTGDNTITVTGAGTRWMIVEIPPV